MVVGKFPSPNSRSRLIKVIVCGEPDFSAHVRRAIIDHRSDQPIEFVKVQYQPSARPSCAANNKDSEKGIEKLSTAHNVVLEKGRDTSGSLSPGDTEKWDEITLCSQTNTPKLAKSQKAWQKKTY